MLKYHILQLTGSCDAGQFLDMETACTDCPEDQWSENNNDVACTPCPGGKTVGSGLGKGESDCALSEFILMVCIFIPLVLCNTITNESNVSKFLVVHRPVNFYLSLLVQQIICLIAGVFKHFVRQ